MKQRIFTAIWGVALVAAVNILGGVPLKVLELLLQWLGFMNFCQFIKLKST